jgi:GAF domain-containing protein
MKGQNMNITVPKGLKKDEMYGYIKKELSKAAGEGGDDCAFLANSSAILNLFLQDINWCGFYLWKKGRLVLGPFQGKPAQTEIAAGQGVCGTAAVTGAVQRVDDVHACTNHIACDLASRSEIVIPLKKEDIFLGVLDIDSPIKSRFDEMDERGLTEAGVLITGYLLAEKTFFQD